LPNNKPRLASLLRVVKVRLRLICFWINFDFMSSFPFVSGFLVYLPSISLIRKISFVKIPAALADSNNHDAIVLERFWRQDATKLYHHSFSRRTARSQPGRREG